MKWLARALAGLGVQHRYIGELATAELSQREDSQADLGTRKIAANSCVTVTACDQVSYLKTAFEGEEISVKKKPNKQKSPEKPGGSDTKK